MVKPESSVLRQKGIQYWKGLDCYFRRSKFPIISIVKSLIWERKKRLGSVDKSHFVINREEDKILVDLGNIRQGVFPEELVLQPQGAPSIRIIYPSGHPGYNRFRDIAATHEDTPDYFAAIDSLLKDEKIKVDAPTAATQI